MKAFFSTDPAHITCSTANLATFTRQLSTLLGAGIPLHEALDSLTRLQTDKLSLWVTPDLHAKIMNGHRFSSALTRFPRVFPATFVALVRGSEESGQLVTVLGRLADWLEKQDSIARQVKKAVIYPTFVIALAGILTLCLFKTVIPSILETVVGLGAELPMPTKILMGIIDLINQPAFWILLVIFVAGSAYYLRTPQGSQQALLVLHHTPAIGGILSFSGGARYSHTLAMLLGTGVDIIRSAKIAADASGNPLIRRDSARVLKDLREGRYLSDVLSEVPVYPELLVDMIRVGDETGRLAELIAKCGDLLEEDTLHRLNVWMELLEPIILAVVSVMVGAILVAILMPMANLVNSL